MFSEKLIDLRKNKKMSQEKLAELMDVSRQTISNWELGSTTPDINQAKKLSKIFKISLDELIDNDIVIKTINNTEKLSKSSNRLSICALIQSFILLITFIFIIIFIIFITRYYFNTNIVSNSMEINCTLNNIKDTYKVTYKDNEIIDITGNDKVLNNIDKDKTPNEIIDSIINYVENNGGTCN